MLSLYEILKASKTGIAPDMWTALAGKNWGGSDSGHQIKELTGIPPLSFRADGTPLLDFLISGNMSQSGTPSPSSIIMPSECGDKTGNLLDFHYLFSAEYIRHTDYFDYYKIQLEPNTAYTVNSNAPIDESINTTTFMFGLSDVMSTANDGVFTTKTIITGSDGVAYIARRTRIGSSAFHITTEAEFSNGTYYIMLNTGSTALPYEPYGIKIPILSGGTTTPVYLGEVQTERKIVKYEFTGQEAWDRQTPEHSTVINLYCPIQNAMPNSPIYCNVVAYDSRAGSSNDTIINIGKVNSMGTNLLLDMSLSEYGTTGVFKTYLQQQYSAGTPVTVWYVLATPTTGIVNEPIRKIGDYTDTLSMEQAGVSIPTLNGQTVVDVDTTLKPSEMYIKYQG